MKIYDKALQALDEAIRLDPTLSEAWFHKGHMLDKMSWEAAHNAVYNKRPMSPEMNMKYEAWNGEARKCFDKAKELHEAEERSRKAKELELAQKRS